MIEKARNIDTCDKHISEGVNSLESISSFEASLSSLLQKLNDLCSPDFILVISGPIVAAIVGALSAYLFNKYHWLEVEKRRGTFKINSTLCSLINDLEVASVDYWLNDEDTLILNKSHFLEIGIKSKLRLIDRYIRILRKDCALSKDDLDKYINKLEEFHDQTFDLVTGDDFESKDRKVSKNKAQKISFICTDIKALLLSFEVSK